MRSRLLYSFCLVGLTLLYNNVLAAVPVITYTSPNVYTVGTAITTLTPTVVNGVSAIGYGTTTGLSGATLNNPRGVAIDASGNIYVTNSGNNTISKYNSAGTYVGTFGTGATMSSPKDLVFDVSGNAYVLNLGATPGTGSVYKYNSSGVYQSTILSSLNYALGLAIDNSDNLYVADQGAVTVKKYSTSGTLLLSLPTANLSTPLGVAVDASGNIYVLNNGSGNVTKYNSAGTFQSTFLSGFTSAQSITIDGAGNFYIGDDPATNIVRVYNPSGTLLTSKVINDPQGIAVDSKGVIYTSAYYANTMSKTPPTGGYFLSAALPAGLSFNSTTGVISGTPTAAMATTTFTVTAYNASGAGSGTVTITVNPTAPTGTGGSTCGSGTVTLSASGSSPSGGVYNWYAALTGGSSLATGATYAPTITATTTYYVSYTQNGATSTPRTAVTATYNAEPVLATTPTSPTSSFYLSYSFTGNANDGSGNFNNGILQNSPSLTNDRYGAGSSAYSFNGSSQYIAASIATATNPQTFSISVWFKTSSAGGKLVGFGSAQLTSSTLAYDRHIYMNSSGQLYFGVKPGSTYNTISTATSYADGAWHHAVATMSATNGANLYVDGALQASDATMTSAGSYVGYWRVAYDNLASWPGAPASYYFNGSLDDIAIYKTELTAAQVYTLYGAGCAPVCPGSTLTLQANTVSGATYSWSGPGGFTSTLQNPTIASATTANAGTYVLTVTGSNGCTSQLNVTATVSTLPSATFTATSSVNINSNATVTYTGTDPSTSTYSWDFDSGTPSTGTGQGPFTVQWATSGTKTITLNITNAAGCTSSSTQNVTVSLASYGNYAFGETITLNTTSLGITSNLTNFPALLSIQDNNLIISNTCTDKVQNPNGPNYDFAFVSGSSELYYQVESYNQTTGTLLVWVQIPSLTYATNNTITFYYGSKSPTVTHNTAFFANTWASNYLAVFHFNEASYTGSVADGTAGGHTGTTSGMSSADLVTGKIGTAYSFDGSSKKITTNAVSVTGPFTLSAWVKLGATGIDQKVITNQTAAGYASGGYKMAVFTNNIPESEEGVATNRSSTPNPTAFTTGVWHYIQTVYTGTTLSTYVDGSQYKVLTTSNNPTATTNMYIGVGEGGGAVSPGFYFNGIIDEPRVSNVAKTADWLKAEYVNQNSPATFTTVGTTVTNTTNAAAIPGALTYTYKGVTSTYTDAANWDNTTAGTTNQAPAFDGTATLVIPTGKSITMNSDAAVYGLTLSGTATISLSANLSVACNIYNQGTGKIDWNNLNTSKITWNGSSTAQSYNGAASTGYAHVGTMELNNSVGGTVTINSDTLDIYSELKITKGNLAIASGAIMALKSGISQTASVDAIPTGYSITGNVYAERYFKAGTIAANTRNYRLLSSPVNTATGVYNLSFLNTNSGAFSGVFTGGPTGTGGGFTVTNAASSLYLYREDLPASNATFNSGNFKGLTNILGNTISYYTGTGVSTATTTLPVGNGYLLYYAGNNVNNITSTTALNKQNRVGGSYIDPDASTAVAVGTLNQGSIPVKLWWNSSSTTLSKAQTGYNLVGNPYASSIDWDTFSQSTSTNGIYGPSVSATIYVFNYSSKNYGAYTALTPGGIGTNNATRYIASGQGFFIQATSASASLTFNEVAKTTTQPNSLGSTLYLLMGLPKETKTGLLRIKLAADEINTDDIMILFDPDSKNEYEPYHDADRLKGIGNVSTLASYGRLSSTMLSINRMHSIDSATRIKLHVNVTNSNNADTLSAIGFDSLDPRYDVYLIDHYKNDSLFFSKYHQYLFNIDKTDTTSFGANRFELVFHKKASYNYRLLGFAAKIVKEGVQLTWKTENEGNLTGFNIERKDGTSDFVSLQSMQSNGSGQYTYIDRSPAVGINYYRLLQADPFGTVSYSKVIAVNTVSNNIVNDPITLYPNPVSTQFTIKINTAIPAKVLLRVTNAIGQTVIYNETNGNNIQQSVANLVPGSYIVEVTDKATRQLIGTKKFIKR